MTPPRRPKLPASAPTLPPDQPDPRTRPDERKEGGPDFGKEARQQAKPGELRRDAHRDPPGLDPDSDLPRLDADSDPPGTEPGRGRPRRPA